MTNATEKIECSVTDNAKRHPQTTYLYPLTIQPMDEAAPNVGKTRLSISEAASYACVNRSYFYEKYLDTKLIVPHVNERGRKYIELAELIEATGPLPGKKSGRESNRQHSQTDQTTPTDNVSNTVAAQVLQAKIDGLQEALKAKDEIVRLKDEQLQESKLREAFYQDELRTVRMLAAPLLETEKLAAPKRRKFL